VVELDLGLAASFLVLVDERHYGRAAARLHLTSPALTKRIQRLERQLGVVLIERGPAGLLCLTGAGQRFANAAGPLLAHAEASREAALRRPHPYVVRIGIPAGTGEFLFRVGLAAIVRGIRRSCPEASFTCREVPFPALDGCLADGAVDVLWNSAEVRHPAAESVPLRASCPLVGVVSAVHPLAEAGSVGVEEFCEEPMLYNPTLAAEWMDPFWLADVRPRREARLVEYTATDQLSVLRKVADGEAVIATPSVVGPLLTPTLRGVTLVGAKRLEFHAARRHNDRRDAVLALMAAFQSLSPDVFVDPQRQGSVPNRNHH
jgi:DNA-binding transcriptional LysR family regulator